MSGPRSLLPALLGLLLALPARAQDDDPEFRTGTERFLPLR